MVVDRPGGEVVFGHPERRLDLEKPVVGGDPPADRSAEFEAFATTLVLPDITEALRGAQPLDDPAAIRFPAASAAATERLRRFRSSCWSPATPTDPPKRSTS